MHRRQRRRRSYLILSTGDVVNIPLHKRVPCKKYLKKRRVLNPPDFERSRFEASKRGISENILVKFFFSRLFCKNCFRAAERILIELPPPPEGGGFRTLSNRNRRQLRRPFHIETNSNQIDPYTAADRPKLRLKLAAIAGLVVSGTVAELKYRGFDVVPAIADILRHILDRFPAFAGVYVFVFKIYSLAARHV